VVAFSMGLPAHLAALVDGGLRPLGRGPDTLKRVGHEDRGVTPRGDNAGVVLGGYFLERPLRRRIVEGVQHRDAAQELLLYRRAARVGKLDLAELVALLANGDARRRHRT